MTEPREFRAPPAQFDLPAIERDIIESWRANSVESRSLHGDGPDAAPKPEFVFYDGPPFATGLPHYGHLLAGTIKDVIPRYWAMNGYAVERRFGWDCHGLPIESLVEDELNVHGQAEIEALGVPKFNAACRAGVLRFTNEWRVVVQRMGRWVDFDNDYKTMDPTFMESVWWVFAQLWEQGRIYQGHRVQPVSPLLGTPLSNFEVSQGPQERNPKTGKDGHKLRADPSVTVRFKIEGEDNTYLWAWTTTPWTLPSNLALAVHPEVIYAKVRVIETGEIAWVEPGLLAGYQERKRVGPTEELERKPGSELAGIAYEPLLPYFAEYRIREDGSRWAFKVVAADYVTTETGTGIVHQAPAFGEDDFEIGKREGLPLIRPMDLNGFFDERVPEFTGVRAKDADKGIVKLLKDQSKIVDQDTYVHAYPHCYRTDEPLLYMAISTWFMQVEDMREELLANNAKIHWVPEAVGAGRFGNWLAGARDWNLSRNRYWGTPLPIWRCAEDPSDMVCIGSIAELERRAGLTPGSITDIHRESVDEISFPSDKTPGGTMRRITEVFDCWFESGSMPYAQNHYPFDEHKKQYVENNLPADFIAEGLDQTRGWFYTLHVLATALFGRPAFKNVIVNGLILAADGKKMSKRLKNYPDPMGVIEAYGADALRAYLISGPVVRAEPMRFGRDAKDTEGLIVREMVKTAILPLQNAYNFLVIYARADGWAPTRADLELAPKAELDRWILSRVQSFVAELRGEFEAYNLDNLVPAWLGMCDELNNWYIRRGRRRYWRGASETDNDKGEAYATLYRVLVTIAHCMAPVLPFFCEHLYQRLIVDVGLAEGKDADSVHLQRYPVVDDALIDKQLEDQVATVRKVVGLAMGLRERERIGVRRPLASLTVASRDPAVHEAVRRFADDVEAELNVKTIEFAQDDAALVTLSAKANFKVLGKRLGKRMKVVAQAVQTLDAAALRAVLEGGTVEFEGPNLDGGDDVVLGADDLLFHRDPLPGRVAESSGGITVLLDTNVSDELEQEGLARELINRIQNLRKTADLDVSDRIDLAVTCASESKLAAALGRDDLRRLIMSETLSESLVLNPESELEHRSDDQIDDLALVVSLARRG